MIPIESRHALPGTAGILMDKAESPREIDLNGEPAREVLWPLAETVRSEAMQIVEDLQRKLLSVPPGPDDASHCSRSPMSFGLINGWADNFSGSDDQDVVRFGQEP